MSDTAAETPAPAKGGWKKTAIIVGVTGLAAAGGGFWWSQAAKANEDPNAPQKVVKASRGLVKFEPFVVNLADGAGTRFLRATLQLVIEPEEGAAKLAENPVALLELRSTMLELLAQQQAASLVTPEGKAALKAALIEGAKKALHEDWTIADVLFSEFVVQF